MNDYCARYLHKSSMLLYTTWKNYIMLHWLFIWHPIIIIIIIIISSRSCSTIAEENVKSNVLQSYSNVFRKTF